MSTFYYDINENESKMAHNIIPEKSIPNKPRSEPRASKQGNRDGSRVKHLA
jgi:hypothetical protein